MNDVIESNFCILKRPKGRSKFEVYVFQKELRSWLNDAGLSFLDDDFKSLKPLKGKNLFREEWIARFATVMIDKLGTMQKSGHLDKSEAQQILDSWRERWLDFSSERDELSDCLKEYVQQNLTGNHGP